MNADLFANAFLKPCEPFKKNAFIFVNNRLEGNALDTVAAMLEEALANGTD